MNYLKVDQEGTTVRVEMGVDGAKLEIAKVEAEDALRLGAKLIDVATRALHQRRYGAPREQK